MDNCIFCKIASGDIPSVRVFENDDIVVFLDISQVTKGHTLIIPKKHANDVFELSETDITSIYRYVPKIAKAITETFHAKGINIINNNGEAAGQTVFHYHIHLIPRYGEEDGFRAIFTNHMDKYSKEDLEIISDRIKKNL